jgi:lipopolysaccharide transport system ATP-binding protein
MTTTILPPAKNSSAAEKQPIEVDGVTKDFFLLESATVWDLLSGKHGLRSHRALSDVSMTVGRGEIIGVLGHNGAGKSTLLRTLGGIYAPSGGFVTTRGDISAIFELGVTSNEFLNGKEFAIRAFEQMAGDQDELEAYLADVEEFADLGEHFEHPLRTYSAGMKARIYFAVATGFRKSIFLIDEVLSVGDTYFRQRCWRRLRDFKQRGVSGVLATHDWTSVVKLCEQCFVLDHGKVVMSGDSYPVVREYLGYKPPQKAHEVWFSDSMPVTYSCRQHEDILLEFPVTALEATTVSFGISIECTLKSVGWENVMLHDPKDTHVAKGNNVLSAFIPKLPLVPGQYMLHVFMLRRTLGSGAVTELDARTWYHGNSLSLTVQGDEQSGIASFLPTARVSRPST